MALTLSFLSFVTFTTQACESSQLDRKHHVPTSTYELIPTVGSAVLYMFSFPFLLRGESAGGFAVVQNRI